MKKSHRAEKTAVSSWLALISAMYAKVLRYSMNLYLRQVRAVVVLEYFVH